MGSTRALRDDDGNRERAVLLEWLVVEVEVEVVFPQQTHPHATMAIMSPATTTGNNQCKQTDDNV
jgi:hypothetical protein